MEGEGENGWIQSWRAKVNSQGSELANLKECKKIISILLFQQNFFKDVTELILPGDPLK